MRVVSENCLGEYLERILDAYRESVGVTGEGVPRQLLADATLINDAHLPTAREGPTDAVDKDNEQNPQTYSSAVIDTGLEELTPLQLWNTAMSKYQVLQECGAVLQALGPDDTSSEREQALRDETRAIAEAALILRRLAQPKVSTKGKGGFEPRGGLLRIFRRSGNFVPQTLADIFQ